jgi:hypothetical protein
LAIPEEGLRIGRRIDLHRASEAARNLILIRNSVVDPGITLIAVEGRGNFLESVVCQVVVNGLGIEG